MTKDPVVEEVRARGRAQTQRHGNDPGALLCLLRQQAEARPDGLVDTVAVIRAAAQEDSRTGDA